MGETLRHVFCASKMPFPAMGAPARHPMIIGDSYEIIQRPRPLSRMGRRFPSIILTSLGTLWQLMLVDTSFQGLADCWTPAVRYGHCVGRGLCAARITASHEGDASRLPFVMQVRLALSDSCFCGGNAIALLSKVERVSIELGLVDVPCEMTRG